MIFFAIVNEHAEAAEADPPGGGVAFLLVQLGFQAGRQFGERLAPLGLEQRQAGMLVRLAANEGRSQQAIAALLGINATQMVFLWTSWSGWGWSSAGAIRPIGDLTRCT